MAEFGMVIASTMCGTAAVLSAASNACCTDRHDELHSPAKPGLRGLDLVEGAALATSVATVGAVVAAANHFNRNTRKIQPRTTEEREVAKAAKLERSRSLKARLVHECGWVVPVAGITAALTGLIGSPFFVWRRRQFPRPPIAKKLVCFRHTKDGDEDRRGPGGIPVFKIPPTDFVAVVNADFDHTASSVDPWPEQIEQVQPPPG